MNLVFTKAALVQFNPSKSLELLLELQLTELGLINAAQELKHYFKPHEFLFEGLQVHHYLSIELQKFLVKFEFQMQERVKAFV
jgi:hypothetical protein